MNYPENLPLKKPIHVLHISATKSWGGGENHLENLCYELRDNTEVKNSIFCSRGGILHQRLQKTDISFVTAPLSFKMDFRYFLKIGRFCRRFHVDLIHIHDTTALSLTVVADKFYNLPPFIFSKKTSFPIKDRAQTRYKYNYPKIKAILCVSEKTKEIASKNILDKDKLKVIPHGTRFGIKFNAASIDLREKFSLSPEVIIVGNIANHIRAKNLECFIEVADILVNREKRKDLFFVQIGRYSERTAALKILLRQKGLEEQVQFLDFIPGASHLLPQFNISLVTSQSEGIPQFIYESFYNEVPVISTNVGGIPEIIENGENGLLAEKHDPKTMAQHILSLSQNIELQEKFIRQSKKLLMEKFSTELMAEQTLKEYKKATNGKY